MADVLLLKDKSVSARPTSESTWEFSPGPIGSIVQQALAHGEGFTNDPIDHDEHVPAAVLASSSFSASRHKLNRQTIDCGIRKPAKRLGDIAANWQPDSKSRHRHLSLKRPRYLLETQTGRSRMIRVQDSVYRCDEGYRRWGYDHQSDNPSQGGAGSESEN
jgi:hypothetical protein